jgi:di/tricarboxylate transporter
MKLETIKGLIVLILAIGLMSLLGLIVVDEFMVAKEHDAELDQDIVELLQMSITGIIGLVAGFIGAGKNTKDD